MNAKKILLVGDINVDSFWPVAQFPIPGRDGLVDAVKFEIGGSVLNTAIILDRLGLRTRLLASLGEDEWKEKALSELAETGIDLDYVQTGTHSTTGLNFIIVTPDGERTMFTYRGANKELKPDMVHQEVFQDIGVMHVSGYALLDSPQRDAIWRAVEMAKERNIPISLDSGLEPVLKQPKDFLRLLDMLTICVSGLEEIAFLLGSASADEAVDQLLSRGIELAAIKMGGKGSLVAGQADRFYVSGFSVQTVDSTGAGDSFSAGLLYGWLTGLDLAISATLASALGALATTVYGAGLSLPAKDNILQFLKQASLTEVDSTRSRLQGLLKHLSGYPPLSGLLE